VILAVCCFLVVLLAFGYAVRAHWNFKRRLAHVDAAAAEAPWLALGRVHSLPPTGGLAWPEQDPETDDGDLFVRMVKALQVFADANGYEVPVPTLWMAIASVTASAILGEDLGAIVLGGGER
jgi:hypothetical protein